MEMLWISQRKRLEFFLKPCTINEENLWGDHHYVVNEWISEHEARWIQTSKLKGKNKMFKKQNGTPPNWETFKSCNKFIIGTSEK